MLKENKIFLQIAMLKNKVAEKEQEIGMLHARLLRRKNSTQRNREEEFSFQELEIKVPYLDPSSLSI